MSDGLKGKRIVNTRALAQAQALDDLLYAHGAIPFSYPCLRIVPPDDLSPLDLALRNLAAGQFDWLVLTSANTVQALRERLDVLGLILAAESWRTAAIGPATAAAAHELLGISGVTVPGEYLTEALADHLPLEPRARVFLPASALAEPTLAGRLTIRGATVCVVEAYQTVCGDGGVDLAESLKQRRIDALTFTSSSAVRCFVQRLNAGGASIESPCELCAARIGPRTAATARAAGFRQVIVPDEHTLTGLLQALTDYFSPARQQETRFNGT
ncbi:MAG: uroporphyrinogen-III synthase [Chloroflexi bacterium]|uniref:uroporphyrinogen-III synthase n=1 Tax=Candidatus Flexifilum breve TaxID=3140694 RepID=UPI00313755C4|nr:uroporphyrinogen-III synthase [Chloroflexota bacterium]